MASKQFEDAVGFFTGESVEELRETAVDERRAAIEDDIGKPLSFRSYFPFIGRGNVLRVHVLSHEQVEKEFLRAVRVK